ncbi:MAG: hypothetical protein KY445_07625 [Armatimonadetes bacterium]|nr:hypothetical protein [Armatimonadota bacterium]
MIETTKNQEQGGKNALEWTVFALSLILIIGVLGFLGFEAISGAPTPPRLEVSLGEPLKVGKQMLVPVGVENRGATTAQGVEIEVSRRGRDQTATFSLPHVPRGGQRQGWVVFEAPLQKSELESRVLGYQEP